MTDIRDSADQDDERPLIAHVIYKLDVGGMENGLVNLVNHLPGDRYRHAIICLTESSEFEQRISAEDVAIYELHKQEGKSPSVYVRFWLLMRRLKPAILHTRNLGTIDLVFFARMACSPICIHGEHGWDAGDPLGVSAKYRLLRRVCDRLITEYVAVSQDIKSWLCHVIGTREDKVCQIYNGVDTMRFRPDGDKADLPFELGDRGRLIFGSVGRLDRIKNFDLLIRGFANLIQRNPSVREIVRLVIVGDGPERPRLSSLIDNLGVSDIVWMPGKRQDIPQLLRSMNVFVLPSLNEGISNTVLEALSTCRPVVATSVGGNRELIINGKCGILIAPDDIDAIESALHRYVDDLGMIKAHGNEARNHVVEHFSLQSMVQKYADMYDRHLKIVGMARIQ